MSVVSIQIKLLLKTCLASVLIVLCISGIELYQQQIGQQKQIQNEFRTFEGSVKQVIDEAVWHYDWNMVHAIVSNQTSQMISFVEVCDQKASKCLQLGEKDSIPFVEHRSSIMHNEPALQKPIEIGSIYLQGHYSPLPDHISANLAGLILKNGLGVFGIALLILFLLHRLAIRRLIALEEFTRSIDLKQIDDIPDRKHIPPARPDEIDMLEAAVADLVAKIKNEIMRRSILERQLTHAQKMEALGTLAGGMAHDFNNILAAIMGHAQLSHIACEQDSTLQRRQQQILNACERARDLIAQVLVFSRNSEIDFIPVQLDSLVEETLQLIRASLPTSIAIHAELEPEVWVVGSSSQLHQVIMNLATNAGHAMKQSGGELRVTVSRIVLSREQAEQARLAAGSYIRLKLVDTGPGIPEKLQARVFEPFFTTKTTGEGTGMGLAVVHGIIQAHGGSILLESKAGKGCTFEVYLPETRDINLECNEDVDLFLGQGQHLLIVDDEHDVASVGKDALEQYGYTVSVYTDPETVLAYFANGGTADLLITDQTMPKMSGVELAAALRRHGVTIPILLYSGYTEEIDEAIISDGVVNRLLHKPVKFEILGKEVHEVLRKN